MKRKLRPLLSAVLVLVLLLAVWSTLRNAPETVDPPPEASQGLGDGIVSLPVADGPDDDRSDPATPPVQDPAPDQEQPPVEDPVPDPAPDPAPVPDPAPDEPDPATADEPDPLPEDGTYTSKDDVALYLHLYGHLPGNFITKKEAQNLGWSGGSLEPYAPGMCIGGDRFGNYEGLLPEKKGRTYTECDIDTLGARSRGAKRIVFSNDGLIYYTDDHYESFTLLYGEEDA